MATRKELLSALARAFVLTESRSPDDPELLDALRDGRDLLDALGWQIMRPREDGFSVNGEPLPVSGEDEEAFRSALAMGRISEVRLQGPLDPAALQEFLGRLHAFPEGGDEPGILRFNGLDEGIGLSFRRGVRPPPGMSGSVESLFPSTEPGGAPDPGLQPDTSGEEETEAAPLLPPEIQELVDAYGAATGPEKVTLGEAIAAAAARLKESREQATVANLVEVLASGSGRRQADPDALDLAIRLTSTGVASQFVGRLGSTREEEERDRLIRVTSGLGREMALALTDALGEARDRFQRRVFMDAVLAQGDLGREMAEKMVEDPRWYVVRNGVALLGELGGEESVSPLTTTLANEDPRVRKETVLALAKVGGEDASMLLLGMLDDPDTEVRRKTCWAVGVLKVERAVKPLLRLLEKDGSERVQTQCLEALGRIGDPGAVPLIEKKAVGRLFSRPSKEIRLAAYRALGAIGTPHARDLLLKATRDSDLDVRKVALGLME